MQTPPDDRRARKARTLLAPVVSSTVANWADLGCGDGVFTLLLAELLPPGSDVYAVDRDVAALNVLLRKLGQMHTVATT